VKNVEAVRQEVVAHLERCLDHLRVRWSMRFGEDTDLLSRIDRTRLADLTTLLANALMRELGDERPGTKEARYDRTRRLANRRNKGPRGVTKAQLATGDVYD